MLQSFKGEELRALDQGIHGSEQDKNRYEEGGGGKGDRVSFNDTPHQAPENLALLVQAARGGEGR